MEGLCTYTVLDCVTFLDRQGVSIGGILLGQRSLTCMSCCCAMISDSFLWPLHIVKYKEDTESECRKGFFVVFQAHDLASFFITHLWFLGKPHCVAIHRHCYICSQGKTIFNCWLLKDSSDSPTVSGENLLSEWGIKKVPS